jgi:two-component system CheB/CheR fusion protein
VLSGTGSDGTLGVRAIKGAAAWSWPRRPSSTEFDGMPRSAIATGLVDYAAAAGRDAAQLMPTPTPSASCSGWPASPGPKTERAEKDLRPAARADRPRFFQYKPSTIHRRIERRMAVHQIEASTATSKYLQQTPPR